MKNDIKNIKSAFQALWERLNQEQKSNVMKKSKEVFGGKNILSVINKDTLPTGELNKLYGFVTSLAEDISSSKFTWLKGKEASTVKPAKKAPEPAPQVIPENRLAMYKESDTVDQEDGFDDSETEEPPANLVTFEASTPKVPKPEPVKPSAPTTKKKPAEPEADPFETLMSHMKPMIDQHLSNGGFPDKLVRAIVQDEMAKYHRKQQVDSLVQYIRQFHPTVLEDACKILAKKY